MDKIMTMGKSSWKSWPRSAAKPSREPGSLAGPYASGAPAIFIDQVARLGPPGGHHRLGVGDDEFGLLNIERLKRDGVDVSAIHVIKEATRGSAFVTYRKDGERDFIFNIATARGQLNSAHVTQLR